MLGVAPVDLLVYVPLTSTTATLDFHTGSWKDITVTSPLGEALSLTEDVVLDGVARLVYTFLTEVDGIYTIETATDACCIPILGKLYACRNDLVLDLERCDCTIELDKSLRTLDVLLRGIVALANMGKRAEAQAAYELASTLCSCCGCINHA